MGYKTVKVPDWVYENARAAQAELLNRGLDSVPAELREPTQCPRCGGDVRRVTGSLELIECSSCSYRQPILGNLSSVGLGVLLGLGVAAFLGELAGAERSVQERAAAALERMRRTAAQTGAARLSASDIEREIRRSRAERRRTR